MTDFSTSVIVRARKQHHCSECRIAIEPRDEYERTFGIWDGRPETFRTCMACVRARSTMLRALRKHYPSWPHEAYEFYHGGLFEELPNAWADTGEISVGRELVLARRRAREARS